MIKKKVLFISLFGLLLTGCNFEKKPTANVTKVQAIEVNINNAFGEEGKKLITMNYEPQNAQLGTLTWTSDNEAVIVDSVPDTTTAYVYVTDYMADYATISVTESLSGKTATGKVYSYAKTKLTYSHTGTGNRAGVKVYDNNPQRNLIDYIPYEEFLEGNYVLEANSTSGSVVNLEIYYEGSYAPEIFHAKSYPNTTIVYTDEDNITGYGVRTVQFTWALDEATRFYIRQKAVPGVPESWLPGNESIGIITDFTIKHKPTVEGMTITDLTFYE